MEDGGRRDNFCREREREGLKDGSHIGDFVWIREKSDIVKTFWTERKVD